MNWKSMRKLNLIVGFIMLTQLTFGQVQRIKEKKFEFNIKKGYRIDRSEHSGLWFNDTVTQDNFKYSKFISVWETDIDIKEENIKDISDYSKFGDIVGIEFDPTDDERIQGVSEIGGKKVYFEYLLTEKYSDWKKNKILTIELEVFYYLLVDGTIYRLFYRIALLNEKEQALEYYPAQEKFRHISNIGDLNVVLESLVIKK